MADKEREQYLKTIAELNATVAELTKQILEAVNGRSLQTVQAWA